MQIAALTRPTHITTTDMQLDTLERLLAIAELEGVEAYASRIRLVFADLVRSFDAELRTADTATAEALCSRMREALLPIMRRSENGWRWYEKPRGYAGDFATIARMYDDDARGHGVDQLLDRCFLDFPAVVAVQNRRGLLTREIARTLRSCGDAGPARVTSLACGPAREVFDSFARIDDPRALAVTLVDFDREALAYCEAERTARDLGPQIALVSANLIHVAVGRLALALEPQDLIYSIGLIDYLKDDLVVALLDWIHDSLAPGGRVIVGNFHPSNPTRAIMDHLLEWKLFHRDEEAMHRLARRSKFGADCSSIQFEDRGINLFAELQKAQD